MKPHKWTGILLLAVFLFCFAFSSSPAPTACQPATSVAADQKQDKSEETVYITNTGKKYHRDGCRFLSKSKIAIKRKDAEAKGYEACKVCKP